MLALLLPANNVGINFSPVSPVQNCFGRSVVNPDFNKSKLDNTINSYGKTTTHGIPFKYLWVRFRPKFVYMYWKR